MNMKSKGKEERKVKEEEGGKEERKRERKRGREEGGHPKHNLTHLPSPCHT